MNLVNSQDVSSLSRNNENMVEFTVELNDGTLVYLNAYEDDIKNKVPYEDTECWIYSKPYATIVNEPSSDDYYDCSVEERKSIYNFCINA